MPYTNITFGELKTQLAERTDATFWTDAERGVLLKEALRTWNVMTGYWRARVAFHSVASTPFYELDTLPEFQGIFDYTLTDRDLIVDLQYKLIEPPQDWVGGSTWNGTDMFTMDDLVQAIQRRRNQFLLDTGCALHYEQIPVGAPPIGRFVLPTNYIDVRRFAWKDAATGLYSNLSREDEYAFTVFLAAWANDPSLPLAYSIAAVPPITVQVAPVPLNNGTMDLISTQSGAALDPATGVLLGLPDDFAWVVEYGALADLLSKEGQANDPLRAQYAEQRYQQGVQLARLFASVMTLQVNDVPVGLDALDDWDTYDSPWQNTSGEPMGGAMAGFNILGLNKVPDGVYGLSVDVVQKAPIPVDDAALVQVGQEDLDAILAIAEHAGDFKMAGAEFSQSVKLYQQAMAQAAIYNGRLMEAAPFELELRDRESQEEDKRGRRRPKPAEVASGTVQ